MTGFWAKAVAVMKQHAKMRGSNMDSTKSGSPYVRQLALGPMKNFVYLVGSADGHEAFVIDPAWDAPAILMQVDSDERTLAGIVLTHHHADHINAVPDLLAVHDLPVYAQRAEIDFAEALKPFAQALRPVSPGEHLTLAGVDVQCMHTPGHTPGAQCLHCFGALFSGDTLFVNACGRCDFEGSDPRAMYDSLVNVLGQLGGATTLYPGHDYGDVKVSSLARERERNPSLQFRDAEAFVSHRMRPRR